MAISFDNATSGRVLDGTTTSFTVASGAVMYMAINGITSVTYNGVSLTQDHSFTSPISDGNGNNVTVLRLLNPASGANNLVFSVSGGGAGVYAVATYTGARDMEDYEDNYSYGGDPPANTQVSTLSGTVTTLTNNAWTLLFIVGSNNAGATFTGGTGTTLRASSGSLDTNSVGLLDSNGVISPAGNSTLTGNWVSSGGFTVLSIGSLRPISVPSAPTIGTASQVNGNLQVTFSDNDNGGSAITGHTATATPGGATATGTSPITFTGLNGGVSYTFKVKATNAIGDSAESSASNAVTLNTGMMAFF